MLLLCLRLLKVAFGCLKASRQEASLMRQTFLTLLRCQLNP